MLPRAPGMVLGGYEFVQEQKQTTLVDWNPGQRPWCRVCQRPATSWGYDHYAGNFQGFWVRCHGDIMGGLIANQNHGYNVLEVFCYDEPHVPNGFWWFVGYGGLRKQETPLYILETAVPAFFQSRTAAIMRRFGLPGMGLVIFAASTFLGFLIHHYR